MGNGARDVRICSYDGAWYTEHNGTTFVTVSQILVEWSPFFVRHDNIWQTIIVLAIISVTTRLTSIPLVPLLVELAYLVIWLCVSIFLWPWEKHQWRWPFMTEDCKWPYKLIPNPQLPLKNGIQRGCWYIIPQTFRFAPNIVLISILEAMIRSNLERNEFRKPWKRGITRNWS